MLQSNEWGFQKQFAEIHWVDFVMHGRAWKSRVTIYGRTEAKAMLLAMEEVTKACLN